MAEREPTNAEILAAAIGIQLAARRMIEGVNRSLPAEMLDALDATHEGVAVAGGSLLHLAERLGLASEVNQLVKAGQARLATFRAFQGQGGRA